MHVHDWSQMCNRANLVNVDGQHMIEVNIYRPSLVKVDSQYLTDRSQHIYRASVVDVDGQHMIEVNMRV